jgi:hypothetical protein
MAKRAKKRISKKVNKVSWFEKVFSFPAMAAIVFVALSVFTFYKVFQPGSGVLGASSTYKYKVRMTMFKDGSDGNLKRDLGDVCLAKTIKISVTNKDGQTDGPTTTYTVTGSSDCGKTASSVITVKGNCNLIQYSTSSLSNWTLLGFNYSDMKKDPGYVYGTKVKVCMYPMQEGLSVSNTALVNFAMRQK